VFLMKLLKAWRQVRRDTGEVDPAAQVAAVINAYQTTLADHGLTLQGTSFSVGIVADSDGDADAGDAAVLYSVCDRYACWYVFCEGTSARVIAFYAFPSEGWADEETFAYSEEIAQVAKHLGDLPAPGAAREAVDAWLVKALADEPETVAKSGYRPIAKDDTQRYTLGVAYPHSELDSHGDFTDEQELEKAAWTFMQTVVAKGAGGVGTDHADGTDDSAQVVESYIYRGPDWTIDVGDDEAVIVKAGDWMVGAIWTEEAWERVEKGELTGWSIQGLAMIDPDATLEA
jgi:subtilisin family serine protease